MPTQKNPRSWAEQNKGIALLNEQILDLKILVNKVMCENQDLSPKFDELHNANIHLKIRLPYRQMN